MAGAEQDDVGEGGRIEADNRIRLFSHAFHRNVVDDDCTTLLKGIERRTRVTAKLQKLIDASRDRPMSDAEQEAQRRSFAYGNAHIENDRVTREMVDEAADKLARKRKA